MNERLQELNKLLNEAAAAYHGTGQEIMSDHEYDRLYEELVALERETGIILEDSPTKRVGAKPAGRLEKTTHEQPALSLDKTKDVAKLADWLGEQEGVLSWKMDGLTVVLTYEGGRLVKAATRGDGMIGEIITGNAKYFHGIPKMIPFSGKLILRGEAVISYQEFERINHSLPEGEEPYKNPRNLASGTVRLLQWIPDRKVDFHAFTLVLMEGGAVRMPDRFEDQMQLLADFGFGGVEYQPVTSQSIEDAVKAFEQRIPDLEFPTDGLVLTLNDTAYGRSLGTTGKYPRDSIAFKWRDDEFETILRDVEWSPSATGLINPVAVYDPVEVEGTTISRASVHNLSIMEGLRLGYGDTITVYKANKIIPQVAENLTGTGNIKIPEACPACGKPTEIRVSLKSGRETKTLYCTNPECPVKHLGMFSRFVCRDAMNIVGLSDETLKKLIDHGFLHRLADIYHLEEHSSEIAALDGFGELSVKNLLDAIEASRDVEPWRFLYAMNIPNVGRDASKKIIRYCGGTISGFVEKLRYGEDLTRADTIGEVISQSVYDWKQDHARQEDFADLIDRMRFKESADTGSEMLTGKTVVITGSLVTFKNREAFIQFVEQNGGKVSGSVSKKTDYLVNNDALSNSTKNRKAKELEIPILTEEEFRNLVLGN
ncbi:MAG: NAD-dependent DNA ligase LigA [Clostridiales bacterium]|nr:NAD-dependent DNA ligase LigA [Clostridiales bacterium]